MDKTTWGGNHYHVKQFGIEEADDGTDCVRELSRDPGGGPLVVKIPEDEQLYSSLALAAKAVGDEQSVTSCTMRLCRRTRRSREPAAWPHRHVLVCPSRGAPAACARRHSHMLVFVLPEAAPPAAPQPRTP